MFFAPYYTPSKLRRPQPVDGKQGGANFLIVPKGDKTYGIHDIQTVQISVNLRPDHTGGTFTAKRLDGVLPTSGLVTVSGSWSCSSVFSRPT